MPDILQQPQTDSEIYKNYCSHCFYNVNSACQVLPEAIKPENICTTPRTYKGSPEWGYLGVCDSFFIPLKVLKQLLNNHLKLL